MDKLVCDICGGSLMMQAGGQTAVCDSCGMQYSVERMREKVQEIRGTVRVEGPVQVRQTGTDDDVFQWRALVHKYYDAGDFQGAEQVVKKILEAVPGDEKANQLYDQLQVLKFMEVKNGILIKYTGTAENVTIPGCIRLIESYAFSSSNYCMGKGNPYIKHLYISEGVTEIGAGAFQDTSIESVHIPGSVTSIGDSAFKGTLLGSVHIPDGVTSIGYSAFEGTLLESVDIPDSVTSIGDYAFACHKLTSVTIPEQLIRSSIFRDYDSDIWCPWYQEHGRFIEERRVQEERRAATVCQHCGGEFSIGFFGSIKCSKCGRPKDY